MFKPSSEITLNEADHKYILSGSEHIEFTSVTTCISKYFEEFDKIKIATNLKQKNPKYKHLTIDEIIDSWDKAAQFGTDVHKEIEDYINHRTIPSIERSSLAIKWLNNYLMKSDFDLFSETIVFCEKLKLAGTVDLLLYDKINDLYSILDWKTSKKIDTVGFKNKTGNKLETQDLLDTNFNHYTLQLSLYRYLLEKKYSIKIQDQIIVHLTDDSVHSYLTDNLSEHIQKILKHY